MAGDVTDWMGGLAHGDEQAAQRIWERYHEQLVRLARRRLGEASRGMSDEEDVMLIAFNSFCEGVAKGRFPRFDDRNDLWRILITITARKARAQVRGQKAIKHGGKMKRHPVDHGDADFSEAQGTVRPISEEPTPWFAAQAAEQCQRLMDCLHDDALRRVAQAKLECYTNEEIAERLGCAIRTVKRCLSRIRNTWLREGLVWDDH